MRFLIIFWILLGVTQPLYAVNITPSHVYAEVKRIEADVLTIMKHRGLQSTNTVEKPRILFKPRHVWQKTYEVLVKINILHRTENYPTIAVNALQPTKSLPPRMVYDQTQRILTELHLIKGRMNLLASAATPPANVYKGKIPSDVYALLQKVSRDMDTLHGKQIIPSDVFAQVLRLNSDIDVILAALDIRDASSPPVKNKASQPKDAFQAAMKLMQTTHALQRLLAIDVTDFSGLKKDTLQPADVFSLVGLIIAELQPIKGALSLPQQRTPFAKYYEGKTPADVEQMLGWCNNKFEQVSASRL